jgi:hypothetical protein
MTVSLSSALSAGEGAKSASDGTFAVRQSAGPGTNVTWMIGQAIAEEKSGEWEARRIFGALELGVAPVRGY